MPFAFGKFMVSISRLWNFLVEKLGGLRKPRLDQAAEEWREAHKQWESLKSQLEKSHEMLRRAMGELTREAQKRGLPVDKSSLLQCAKWQSTNFERDWELKRLQKHLESLCEREASHLGDYKASLDDFSRFVRRYTEQFERARSRLELALQLLQRYADRKTFDSVLPLEAALDAPEFVETVCRATEKRLEIQRKLVAHLRSLVSSRLDLCERRISLIADCEVASKDDLDELRQRLIEFGNSWDAGGDNEYRELLSLQNRLDPLVEKLEDLALEAVGRKIQEASRRGWELLGSSNLIKQKGRKGKTALRSLQKPYPGEDKNGDHRRRRSECLKTVSNLKKIVADP